MKEEKIKRLESSLGYTPYFNWVKRHWSSRGEPLDFKKHKYLVQIYQDQHPHLVWMKPAQRGLTERCLTEAVWLPDQFQENALYFFPTSGSASDLVQERVDEPINNSEYLSEVSGRAKKILGKQADKIGMKRMSKGFVYFRGTTKPTQITSVPGDIIFADEVDRMPAQNIPYFDKRLEHSKRKWMRWASTPTVPNMGIHAMYLESDQHEYYVKCTHCDEWQQLTFWDNIDQKRLLLVCKKCKEQIIPWECETKWIAANPESDIRGYYIPPLCSPRLDIKKLIKESKKTAEWEVQQFYNQNLGLPYEPKGAKISEEDIESCIRDYIIPYQTLRVEGRTVGIDGFMGVDVGKLLHVVVFDKNRLAYIGTCKDFEDLDLLMKRFNIKKAVIDAMPETRKAQEFADRHKGRVHLCWYTGLKEPKEGEWFRVDGQKINTDRTISLDMTTNEIKTQAIELPKNINDYPDFKQHLKNLTRVVKEVKGNSVAEYVQVGEDHFRHTVNYASIARAIFSQAPIFDAMVL